MNSPSVSRWPRYAAIAVALLFALGFAAMQTVSTSSEEDGAILSKPAGPPSEFVASGGAVPDSDASAASSTALMRAAPTIVARAHKD